MTKCIVYARPDGGVSITLPSPTRMAELMPELTEDKALAVIQKKALPTNATHIHVCDISQIPDDTTFRNAWERDTSSSPAPIKTDMPKARVIHRDRLRLARTPKLQDLDVKWMRAVATDNSVEAQRMEADRQKLRDLPDNPDIDTASTPEALKATWPAELPR